MIFCAYPKEINKVDAIDTDSSTSHIARTHQATLVLGNTGTINIGPELSVSTDVLHLSITWPFPFNTHEEFVSVALKATCNSHDVYHKKLKN